MQVIPAVALRKLEIQYMAIGNIQDLSTTLQMLCLEVVVAFLIGALCSRY